MMATRYLPLYILNRPQGEILVWCLERSTSHRESRCGPAFAPDATIGTIDPDLHHCTCIHDVYPTPAYAPPVWSRDQASTTGNDTGWWPLALDCSMARMTAGAKVASRAVYRGARPSSRQAISSARAAGVSPREETMAGTASQA